MRRFTTSILFLAAAGAIALGVSLPLWQVSLFFPQYPEGPLRVVAHAGALSGDLSEINMLNHYIGVAMPKEIPELDLLPKLLYGVAILAVLAALFRGRIGLWLKGGTIAAMVGSVVWALWRINGYLTDFGANPDPSAPLSGVMKPFKPPLFGRATIVQVEAEAIFLGGTYLLLLAGILLGIGFWLALRQRRSTSVS